LRGRGRERRIRAESSPIPGACGRDIPWPGDDPAAHVAGGRRPDDRARRVRAETPAPPVFGKENAATHVKRGPRCLNPNALLGEGIQAF
jgi:hypothetical protein